MWIQYGTPSPTTQFWKYWEDEWQQYPASSFPVENYTLWEFQLTDGATGDNDGIANAVIIDPFAGGLAAAFTG